jgi:hypothetical protein
MGGRMGVVQGAGAVTPMGSTNAGASRLVWVKCRTKKGPNIHYQLANPSTLDRAGDERDGCAREPLRSGRKRQNDEKTEGRRGKRMRPAPVDSKIRRHRTDPRQIESGCPSRHSSPPENGGAWPSCGRGGGVRKECTTPDWPARCLGCAQS